jgi:hypothetical protein
MIQQWQKELIKKAFKSCYGLKDALGSRDELMLAAGIDSLSKKTGMRKTFLKENLEEIKTI